MKKRPGEISHAGGDYDDDDFDDYDAGASYDRGIANKKGKPSTSISSSTPSSSMIEISNTANHFYFGQKGGKGESSSSSNKSSSSTSSSSISVDPLVDVINHLSLEDRTHGLNLLHGIDDTTIEESPESLEKKIQEMPNAISTALEILPESDTTAFRKALQSSQKYINSLMAGFLRSSDYKTEDAARRLIAFFHQKMLLFGEDNLVKEITQDELDEETLAAARKGLIQILHRDRSGRPVIYVSGRLNITNKLETVLQCFVYTFMALLGRDKETQLRGIVFIWDGIGVTKTRKDGTKQMCAVLSSLPTRMCGMHVWGDNMTKFFKPTRLLVSKYMERCLACRYRFHEGSTMECIYAVLTFGIPREAIPIAEDGSPDLTKHHKMLELLKSKEDETKNKDIYPISCSNKSSLSAANTNTQTSPTGESRPEHSPKSSATTSNLDNHVEQGGEGHKTILIPGPMDVLLGRGRQPASRPGSLKMHHLVLENLAAYDSASDKFEKTKITQSILKQMNDAGCRFLTELPSGGYVECSHDVARTKISLAFRNQRRNKKKKKEKQQLVVVPMTN